eukprot:COSAG01_NODE_90_length_27307_cov_734.166458_20_plen_115_part_00
MMPLYGGCAQAVLLLLSCTSSQGVGWGGMADSSSCAHGEPTARQFAEYITIKRPTAQRAARRHRMRADFAESADSSRTHHACMQQSVGLCGGRSIERSDAPVASEKNGCAGRHD